jgi:hypothetical protein
MFRFALIAVYFFCVVAHAADDGCNPVGVCFDKFGRQTGRKPLAFSGPTNEELVRRFESMLSKCGCQELNQEEKLDCVRGTKGIVQIGTGILHLSAIYEKSPAQLLAKAETANTVTKGGIVGAEEKKIFARRNELSCRNGKFQGLSERLRALYATAKQKVPGRSPASESRQRCFRVMENEITGFRSFVKKECKGPCSAPPPKSCPREK